MNQWFIERNGGESLVKGCVQSQTKDATEDDCNNQENLFLQTKYKSLLMQSHWCTSLTEKKRTYFSDYGFANTREVLLGEDTELVENPQNYEKFYMENVVAKWKRWISKRYNKLKTEGNLRTELEVWTRYGH